MRYWQVFNESTLHDAVFACIYLQKQAEDGVDDVKDGIKEIWPFLGQLLACLICLALGICVGNIDDGKTVMSSSVDVTGENREIVRNWGISFKESGERPGTELSQEVLDQYNAYCMGSAEDKKIYLTFDCGFENGNTPAILDALKKHNAPATFFVVGHYLESAPELVKRMVDEGHIVANHTYHHPDMSAIGTEDAFYKELEEVNAAYKELTGQEMAKYYRPPQGKYTINNLAMAKDAGYSTFFWSLAYVDWEQDKQPDPGKSIEKLCSRIHPGAIVLLHNTSATNAEILDELLQRWEEMGYRVCSLEELCKDTQ